MIAPRSLRSRKVVDRSAIFTPSLLRRTIPVGRHQTMYTERPESCWSIPPCVTPEKLGKTSMPLFNRGDVRSPSAPRHWLGTPRTSAPFGRKITLPHLCISCALCLIAGCGRQDSPRCKGQLMNIARGIMNYQETHRRWPPAAVYDANGNALHSWRVLILPFIQSNRFYDTYALEEPWNGPLNARLTTTFIVQTPYGPSDVTGVAGLYHCRGQPAGAEFKTDYLMIVDSSQPLQSWDAFMARDRDWQVHSGFEDGILIVEVKSSEVHWMEPRDLDVQDLAEEPRAGVQPLRDLDITGALAISPNGTVEHLGPEDAKRRLRELSHDSP